MSFFRSLGRAFKKTGKVIGKGAVTFVKSDLAREITIAAFTAGGLPSVARALRLVDSAIEGGAPWEAVKAGLIERAVKNPEETLIILNVIRDYEAIVREKANQPPLNNPS